MNNFDINKEDVLKAIYFITALTQSQGNSSMQGALSSKGDLMGGIFDRWINIIPESVIFNKAILPETTQDKNVEIISDFYLYDPKKAGIAPDVIGIRVDGKAIPFAIYDGQWKPETGMPQIEVKTFKKPQKMISLRDQGYTSKYLVMTESEFRIDYLLPFFDKSIFSESIYTQMKMDDSVFIKTKNDNIQEINRLKIENNSLGSVSLLKITDAGTFMNCSNLCKGGESPHYIVNISPGRLTGTLIDISLCNYCYLNAEGFYEFNQAWYDKIEPIVKKSHIVTLNLHSPDISGISLRKINKSSVYITATKDTYINDTKIRKDTPYKIEFQILDREGNSGEEYFFSKSIINHIPDKKNKLNHDLKEIIMNA